MKDVIEEVGQLARTVAGEYAAFEKSVDQETYASAALLTAVVHALKPALGAMSSRIKRCCEVTGIATDQLKESVEFHDGDFVRVLGGGPERDVPRADSGIYEGRDLYLRDDGVFVLAIYFGRWSRWQGGSDIWESRLEERSMGEIAENYEIENIIVMLCKLLEKQIGKREKNTKAALARAEQFAALAVLLKGGA